MKKRHRTRSPLLLAAVLLILLPLSTSAASASGWSWGTGFRIGDLRIDIGHSAHHQRGLYFRVDHRIRSSHRCTDYCFVDRDRYYHHETCPVVRGYFDNHGYSSVELIRGYGPYSDGYRYERRGYDRHDRYDRRYDRRYDERSRNRYYDRERDRYRRDRDDRRNSRRHRYDHRHGSNCPSWHYR
jgi:hypothetical protein